MILRKIESGHQVSDIVSDVVFDLEYDVIICGMGTSGTYAALFSAENNLKVAGIEQLTCVGGTHTAGGVCDHYFGCPGGQYKKLDEKIDAFSRQYCCIGSEARKLLAEEALLKKGVDLFYEMSIVGVYLEGNSVVGIQVVHEQKVCNLGAKIVMDCTAEATVANMAGCETEYGRKLDGKTQPYTMVSLTINDNGRYRRTNFDSGRVNQLDNKALTDAIVFSRAYRTPEEKNFGQYITHYPLIGIREGQRIIAEEMVNIKDLFADRQTETPAFFSYADLDKHGWDNAFDGEYLGDWIIGSNLGAYKITIAVPYKAILPKSFDGILVPCRALGIDRDVSSCVRMLVDMKKVAEVGAEWAALAVHQGISLRQVPYSQLRDKLTASGCLNMCYNRGYCIEIDSFGQSISEPMKLEFISDPEELKNQLRTDRPGWAIWSAKRMGNTICKTLVSLLENPEENTRKHAAFALATIGNEACKPVLREMLRTRDAFMLKDCHKNNNIRMIMAIYWLGRMADEESVDMLLERINSKTEIFEPIFQQTTHTTRYLVYDFNDLYFQFMSNAVMALIRIGDSNENIRSKISEGFVHAFSGEDYYSRITDRHPKTSEGSMVVSIKEIALSTVQKWGVLRN